MAANDFDPLRFSDEELKTLLQDETDETLLLQAAEVYAARLEMQGFSIPNEDLQWAEFQSLYVTPAVQDPSRRFRKHLGRSLASIAACVALSSILLAAIASASGLPLWNMVTEWVGNAFQFEWGQPGTPGDPTILLQKYGITEEGIPHWIPKDYRVLTYDDISPSGAFTVAYWNDASGITFSVIPYIEGSSPHLATGRNTEIYRVKDITYYISESAQQTEVIWLENGCDCSLISSQNAAAVKEMLKKMQRR